jgi:hypothetical protein
MKFFAGFRQRHGNAKLVLRPEEDFFFWGYDHEVNSLRRTDSSYLGAVFLLIADIGDPLNPIE